MLLSTLFTLFVVCSTSFNFRTRAESTSITAIKHTFGKTNCPAKHAPDGQKLNLLCIGEYWWGGVTLLNSICQDNCYNVTLGSKTINAIVVDYCNKGCASHPQDVFLSEHAFSDLGAAGKSSISVTMKSAACLPPQTTNDAYRF